MYLVKWKGWEGHEHAQTWEDAKDVDNSLIAAYEDEHGSAHESDELADGESDEERRPAPRPAKQHKGLGKEKDEPRRGLTNKRVASHTLAMGAKGKSSKKNQSKRTLMASDDDSVD
jgi:hypothetical protein